MSDKSRWHVPPRVELNGQPRNPAKSALFLLVFVGFCLGLAAWRKLG